MLNYEEAKIAISKMCYMVDEVEINDTKQNNERSWIVLAKINRYNYYHNNPELPLSYKRKWMVWDDNGEYKATPAEDYGW